MEPDHPPGDRGPLIGAENGGFALAAAFADGTPQAVCRIGQEFRAWDLTAQTPAHPPFLAEAVLRDGAMAAAGWGATMVFAAVVESDGAGGRVRVWDAATGAPCGPDIETADNWITAITLAEIDGTLLAAIADGDHGIQIFDTATGQPCTRRTVDIGLPLVNALAMGTVGGQAVVAAGDESGRILFREIPSLCRFGGPAQAHDGQITALAFGSGSTGGWLASVGTEAVAGGKRPVFARFWVPGKSGRRLRPQAAPIRLPGPAGSIALSGVAGQMEAVTVHGHQAIRWDVRNGEPVSAPLGGGHERVCAVGVATVAGQTMAVSATYGKATIRTWDIPDCAPARHPVTCRPLVRDDISKPVYPGAPQSLAQHRSRHTRSASRGDRKGR